MTRTELLVLTIAALLLEAAPLVAAHGDEHNDANLDMQHAVPPTTSDNGHAQSYWALSDHASLMYWHIALEILAWFVILPVGMSASAPAPKGDVLTLRKV